MEICASFAMKVEEGGFPLEGVKRSAILWKKRELVMDALAPCPTTKGKTVHFLGGRSVDRFREEGETGKWAFHKSAHALRKRRVYAFLSHLLIKMKKSQ